MRIGILSDSHDQLALTQRAVDSLARQGAELLIHCGDLTGPKIIQACASLPCIFAFGNHDRMSKNANPLYVAPLKLAPFDFQPKKRPFPLLATGFWLLEKPHFQLKN